MILVTFIAFFLFLIVLSILKTNNLTPALFNGLHQIPYHDKVGHFILMGILAYLAITSISPWLKSKNIQHPQLIIGSIITLVIIIEETSQAYFPSRSCSWLDATAGSTGVSAALFIYATILTSPRKSQHNTG